MQLTQSPYVAASVALLGAGLIAAGPIAAGAGLAPDLPDVALTSSLDFTGAWQDVFSKAESNLTEIGDAAAKAPLASLQQSIADPIELIKGLVGGDLKPEALFDHLKDQAQNLFQDTTLLGVHVGNDGSGMEPVAHSNDAFHSLVVTLLPTFLPSDMSDQTKDLVGQLVNVLASPLSGVMIGALGPAISPLVELGNSIGDISAALTGDTPDPTAALQELINLPANLVGAELNGATLDLNSLLPAINGAGFLPDGMEIASLDFAFGGLLSPGGTALEMGGTDMGVDTGIGGSILNSLGLNLLFDIKGEPLGPLAALVNFDQIVAGALGWDGVGDPLGDLFGGLSL